ncbi:MAG: ABC transporter permease subunit [Lachnospiraceae bacterium]|nr:ABC transporter permease subunit [Lachnospiraceae bacterium]
MKKGLKTQLKNQWQYHIMLLPAVILVFIFSYIPLYGLIIAFEKYNPGLGFNSPWVGLQNFTYLFSQPTFLRTIRNTIVISVIKLILGIVVPVFVAILLNEMVSDKLKRLYQTLIYIPNFLSWVIVAGLIMDLLGNDGIVNTALSAMGLGTINFLGSDKIFPWTMIVTDVWKGFGYGTVVYMASLTGIDPGLYESAEMDGATRWQRIWYVTIPMLKPIMVLMLVLALGNVFNAGFDQIYNLYSPIVYEHGDIIDTYIYRLGIEQAQYSVGAAVGLFKSAISCMLVLVSYKLADKFAGYKIW